MTNCTLADHWVLILLCSCLSLNRVEINIFPTFEPNDYLFRNGSVEKWETYANAVRDLLCERTGLGKNE